MTDAEIALWQSYWDDRTDDRRNALAVHYRGDAFRLAYRAAGSWSRGLERGEAHSIGDLALMFAIPKWDPMRGSIWSAYLYRWCLHAVGQELRVRDHRNGRRQRTRTMGEAMPLVCRAYVTDDIPERVEVNDLCAQLDERLSERQRDILARWSRGEVLRHMGKHYGISYQMVYNEWRAILRLAEGIVVGREQITVYKNPASH